MTDGSFTAAVYSSVVIDRRINPLQIKQDIGKSKSCCCCGVIDEMRAASGYVEKFWQAGAFLTGKHWPSQSSSWRPSRNKRSSVPPSWAFDFYKVECRPRNEGPQRALASGDPYQYASR